MKEEKEIKSFNVRMPIDMWRFLKSQSAKQELAMIEILRKAVDDYKLKVDYS